MCAALFTLGGAGPAMIAATALATAWAIRSPDRLLDVAYVAAFCGLGYLAG